MQVVAGVDLGGTAVNYTLVDREERFLIEGLCEHPALAKQGARSLRSADRRRAQDCG